MIDVVARRSTTLSPLRYPGGKAALAGFLEKLIEASDLTAPTYVEPFAGGAGAGLALLYNGHVSKIVINDLDRSIHAMWQLMVNDTDDFLDRLDRTPVTINEWQRQREVYRAREREDTDPNDLGFAAFYLNRTNRSGVLNAGVIGGQAQNGTYKIDARFNKATLRHRAERLAKYRKKILVTRQDGTQALRKWLKKPNVISYIDPPYFDKGSFLYLNSFVDQQHGELSDVLNAHADANWILTYDNVPEISSMYADRKQLRFSLNYSAHRREIAEELMVLSRPLGRLVAANS